MQRAPEPSYEDLTVEDWREWRKSDMPLADWAILYHHQEVNIQQNYVQQNLVQQNTTNNNNVVVNEPFNFLGLVPLAIGAWLGYSLVVIFFSGGWVFVVAGLIIWGVYRLLKAICIFSWMACQAIGMGLWCLITRLFRTKSRGLSIHP